MQTLPDLTELSHSQLVDQIRALWPLQQQVADLALQLLSFQERIKQLEARLSLNSKNSSKPPSSDGLGKPAPKSLRVAGQRPNGGQSGHSGNTLRQSEQIDQVVRHAPSGLCAQCHSPLAVGEVLARRQVFELPPQRLHVTEHQLVQARCACGAIHQGQWPQGVNAPTQYGASVKALSVSLSQQHLVPVGRVCEILRGIHGVNISQASVLEFNAQAARALLSTVHEIGKAVQSAATAHADESGIRVNKTLHWLHCFVTDQLSWLARHTQRGTKAFEALDLLGGFTGTLVHDGLASYKTLACQHSLCNAHHLRELVAAHEQDGCHDDWAQKAQDLLTRVNEQVRLHGAPLSEQVQLATLESWRALMARGLGFNPQKKELDHYSAKPGKLKQSKSYNLIRRLTVYEDEVWRFMREPDVPFTNNLAEQALRMCKVKQKVSGCFRTTEGADTFFTIRSYLGTMKKQGGNLLACLHSVFTGTPIQPKFA